MPAGPISLRLVPEVHCMLCPEGQTEPQCKCSEPSPPQSLPLLSELSWHAANTRASKNKSSENRFFRYNFLSIFC